MSKHPHWPRHDGEPLSYEEYAALWGCDPSYDRWPRHRGDGYLFYNYGSEREDPEFLKNFILAINRTIRDVYNRGLHDGELSDEAADDIINLRVLQNHCKRQLRILLNMGVS